MIERELYMQQIRPFMNRPFVKVVAGIRRCGKSVVLQLIAEELKRQGVTNEHIVYMNFESFEWMDVTDAKALYLYVKNKVKNTKGKIYILLDEIQEVKEGRADAQDNVLLNAPHPEYEIVEDTWEHSYTRRKAAYPTKAVSENKFWVNVARVDNTLGDRKLLPTLYGRFD